MAFDPGTPILLKATVIRVRDGFVEVQTRGGQLVRFEVEDGDSHARVDKDAAKSQAAAARRAEQNPPPSPGFAENAVG